MIASIGGAGEGKDLMFNGHIDTVPPFGMNAPFDAEVRDGKLFGRGSTDMKSGVGAMVYSLIILKRLGIQLKGKLVFAGVIDEDAAGSAGTRYVVEHGPRTDLAIVGEPTKLFPVIAHKGCDYFEDTFHGKSVHSSVPENGSNAIFAAADFIERIENTLIPEYNAKHHDLVGSPTINAGLIQGGAHSNIPFLLGGTPTFLATIPDLCKVYLDVRWTPDQTIQEVTDDIKKIIDEVKSNRSDISADIQYYKDMARPAMEISDKNKLVKSVQKHISKILNESKLPKGETFWADSGLLYDTAGIPTLIFGPGDIKRAHSDNEFINISDLVPAVKTYIKTALDICGYRTH